MFTYKQISNLIKIVHALLSKVMANFVSKRKKEKKVTFTKSNKYKYKNKMLY